MNGLNESDYETRKRCWYQISDCMNVFYIGDKFIRKTGELNYVIEVVNIYTENTEHKVLLQDVANDQMRWISSLSDFIEEIESGVFQPSYVNTRKGIVR